MTEAGAGQAGPAISVIVVTEGVSDCLRWMLECLRRQTAASQIECVLVSRSREAFASIEADAGPLHSLRILERKKGTEVMGAAKAAGVLAATAPFVAFAEDHSYPDARWAESLLDVHREGLYAAVGPVVQNANPVNAQSWGCFLVYYGMYMTAGAAGEAPHLPGNHSSYPREVLLELGPRLPEVLESEIALHGEMISRGKRLHQEPRAIVYHLNYSAIGPAVREYFLGSRVFASERSRSWGLVRRLLYACGTPLVPLIRLPRILRQARDARLGWRIVVPVIFPALVILCAGAAGEMLGYSLGPGAAKRGLAEFELEHAHLFSATDLAAVAMRQTGNRSRG
ncbi:MAG TPA: glycosyltransferase [Bryobacteraceae bacterium]|nr:glycosyltransferase [Bryobacteraceae bacterium]